MILDLPDGATVEILTPVGDGLPCVMRGTIPAGGIVPLHSHADPETFLMLDGEIEGFVAGEWSRIAAGDVLHVPGHSFFREVAAGPERFLEISGGFGYWNATPEENAAIGLTVPVPARP